MNMAKKKTIAAGLLQSLKQAVGHAKGKMKLREASLSASKRAKTRVSGKRSKKAGR
jgi:hypothetical protein